MTNFKESAPGEIFRFQLNNGLDIVLMKDLSSPVVAVDLWYKVGSKNEEPGKSGFAHLFEHMMFQGSENVKKTEHMNLISDVGGWMNGSTSQDRTNYFEVVPSNQLELALWLEADRMRSLAVNKENFENQRSTVKEERRQRVDNAPYAPVFYELLDELAYENWAYKHSVIGSMEDLDNATLEDVIEFHGKFYRPNNTVLAIAGHFDFKKTMEMLKKYFEIIPAGDSPPAVDLTEPAQTTEKRMTWEDPFAPMPAYVSAYHIPSNGEKDHYVLELIEKILFDGESSRLYKILVEEKQVALHLFGGVGSKFGPNLFLFFAQITPGHSISEVEELIFSELEKLKNEPLSERELTKVKNQFKAEYITSLEKVYYRADQLCKYTAIFNDPDLFHKELDRFLEVTSEDIQKAAKKYYINENRNVIEVIPRKKAV
jgi:predicted Zn-dependent peptidase